MPERGDIVRDRSTDAMVPEWVRSSAPHYEVLGVGVAFDPIGNGGPYRIAQPDGSWAMQMRVVVRPLGESLQARAGLERTFFLYDGHGPTLEVVKTVEERMAEELMA